MSDAAALIVGGTSGIGLATAHALHRQGSRVAVTGRDPETLRRARDELPDDVLVVPADVASLDDTERVVDVVAGHFGRLTTLILNAGVARRAEFGSVDEATYDEVFAVNARGQFFLLQRVLPLLVDGASIIVTVGIGTIRGRAGLSLVAGSRGALFGMVSSLAVELAPRRIRVNVVSPGAIDTPIWAKSGATEDMLARLRETIPFGRLGEAREVAEVVAFLASDAASYVTGQNLVVAGGVDL